MMLRPSILKQAIRIALLTSSGVLITAPALAQNNESATEAAQETQQSSDAKTLEAVRVQGTGSRIVLPGVDTSSPVMSMERSEFLTTQTVAVENFVKEMPAVTPSIGSGTNNGTTGAAEIDMRGLGSNRTLVLVNGRRPVPYDLKGVVDTNTIPLSLLQSVDLLTGGASVVYGADAVAGVANFILRRDFHGIEVNGSYGQTKYGDGARQNLESTFGVLSDDGRANVVFSVGKTKVDPVFQGDRSWSVYSMDSTDGTEGGSGTTIPARVTVPGLKGVGGLSGNTGQIDPVTGQLVDSYYFYNFNPLNYYQTGFDRWQATALGRYEMNEHAEVYGQFNYTRSKVGASLAPSGIFGESFDIPIGNPYIPDAARQQICQAQGIAAGDCVVGNTTTVPMTISRRLVELGPRRQDFDTKTFQATVGLRGAITDNWKYDGFWSYGESDQVLSNGNWGSLSKTTQALNAISTTECLNTTNNCVPLNPFGVEGSITPEMLNFINLSAFSMQNVKQTNAGLNFSGDLGGFKFPTSESPIGMALGVEYRKSEAGTNSDAASQTNGEVMGTGAPVPNSNGSFKLLEAYVESIVPIVTDRPAFDNLSVELGYRHSEFETSSGFKTD